MGTLYLVATPIGNLEDITLRALRVLREVGLIAAEDTRRARVLLKRYEIGTPVTSYFEHNKLGKLEYMLAQLASQDVALVSEAGTPAISDPGYELVVAAVEAGYPVVPIPGASALVSALAASGLPTDQFVYVGFLPRQAGERRRRLASLAGEARTIVVYEAPHRLSDALRDILAELGDRRIAVARELTKVHEEIVRGRVSEAIAHFESLPARGELTLVVEGSAGQPRPVPAEEELEARFSRLIAEGLTPRRASAVLARETGLAARDLYRQYVSGRSNRPGG